MSHASRQRGLRRRRPNFDDSSSSWLVTYSDAITLLLAFFVMILAVSDLNEGKIESLKEGLAEVISSETTTTPFTDIRQGIDDYIEQNGLQDQVSVTLDPRGVQVEFANVALYDSGAASLKPAATPLLQELSRVIRDVSHGSHMIEVEGHTDDLPISNEQFPSNWELSSARATGVVKYLLESGIEKERLKASGYADSRPKEGLDDLPLNEQRKANRRVVVSIRRY
ncbi:MULTISPECIES: OmpA/MotB family protein [Thalassolituus]|jgi:chemotaxis protein MotB|uniref:OmpA/MotB family protein n=1 Tax=Thalassolituus TaxID=187492 RepID=UPI000C0D8433|nr:MULTISPECIES: OmpA family protein [Thalassolituus]MAX85295.1 chemotaxis protein MotB [Oceanospirillaceae bacterium]MDQ4422474.1 OmpA family protein [Thalassolituus sp.]MEC9409571.1 OmpA family protein [Pseudomonadota bacterium]MBN57864.1 chemotaxis protein MotB [Oceanospirillaceae bacterium]MEE3160507.1 OmpA family protein [Pseudomonadota bacterium]|tara:strand:- start:237 stop:911 length:675 start_codon:yes stop_codon:yes gene_type:complete